MVTEVTPTSFKIDDELVDLLPLHTRVQLLHDGAIIHRARTLYALASYLPIMLERGYEIDSKWEERTQQYITELRILLHKAGV